MIKGLAFMVFTICSAQASQIHTLSEEREIWVDVSKTELNRIIVEKDRISDVFTHGSNLEILPDERIGQIFLKALSSPKEGIQLTLTTEEGRVQDMRLRTQVLPGQTIILKESVLTERREHAQQVTAPESLVAILTKFLEGKIPFGFKLSDSCEEQRVFTSDRYTVEDFDHTNTSDQTIQLEEGMFASHPNIRAILIPCPLLEPGESTPIWRVSRHD